MCCCQCAVGPLPESFIGVLEPGDHVRIKAGAGFPEVSEDTETVIASVEGNSALTVEGIILHCGHENDVAIIPGEKLPIVLTTRAREMMEEAGLPLPGEQEPVATAT